jgi:hypothetical protein
MSLTRDEIRQMLDDLAHALAPWGVCSSEDLATLLRDPDGPRPRWPSAGYVRLARLPSGPRPSDRFGRRVALLKSYVDQQLAGAAPDLAWIRDRLGIRAGDAYDPAVSIKFVKLPASLDVSRFALANADVGAGLRSAPTLVLVGVPEDWLRVCHWEECGRLFPARSKNALYCCHRHRRLAANQRRRERMAEVRRRLAR